MHVGHGHAVEHAAKLRIFSTDECLLFRSHSVIALCLVSDVISSPVFRRVEHLCNNPVADAVDRVNDELVEISAANFRVESTLL